MNTKLNDDILASTGNTAKEQEMFFAGVEAGEANAKNNADVRGADGWLPIESAPKDGSYVLLRGQGDHRIADGYWLQSAYNGNGAWIWPYVHSEPMHWMLIPAAPGAAPAAPVSTVEQDELQADVCPRCDGSGEITVMSDNSPDAHDVIVCCDHCQGSGSAVDAAKYLAAALAGEKYRHLQLWGEYRNFHRSLCARFGYGHDEVHFRRDLVSLEEAIAAKVAAPAAGDALTAQQRKEFIRRASFISEGDHDTRAAFVDEIARAALASAPVAVEHHDGLRMLLTELPGMREDPQKGDAVFRCGVNGALDVVEGRIRELLRSAPVAGERECGNADCGWRGTTERMCGSVGPLCPECGETTEASAPVAGEAQPVGRVRHFNYSGIARNGFSQEAVLNDDAPSLPDGTLLYAAPQASEAVRVHQLEAARIAYASEFPPDEHGDPDVSSIHANIRKLKAQYSAARNAALEEAADFSAQYIRKFGPGGVATAIRALKQSRADKDGCTCPSGDGSLLHPCPMHPGADKDGGQQHAGDGQVYGPYRVKWIGAGVWAGITDELPGELEGKDVFIRAALSATQTEQGERKDG